MSCVEYELYRIVNNSIVRPLRLVRGREVEVPEKFVSLSGL
jgi:hypothetical protein